MHEYIGYFHSMYPFWWSVLFIPFATGLFLYFIFVFRNIQKEKAMDILEKRFAKREISKEEFERAKTHLQNRKWS